MSKILQLLDNLFSILSSLVVIITAICGFIFSKSWKKQDKDIKEKGIREDLELKKIWRNNDLATKTLKSLYGFRDSFVLFRHPFISIEEINDAYINTNTKVNENIKNLDLKVAYSNRWQKLLESFKVLKGDMAEISIVDNGVDISKLDQFLYQLYNALLSYQRDYHSSDSKEFIDDVYNKLGLGYNDKREEFANKVKAEITDLENKLKSHIVK